MPQRNFLIVGNWKMNKLYVEGIVLANNIISKFEKVHLNSKIVICPPFIHLQTISNMIKEMPNFFAGAQNCHEMESGAITGEVSASMLKSVGVEYVIIGHSERRSIFGENDSILSKKINAVLSAELKPIFCCGENLEQRNSDEYLEFVENQIKDSLFHLSSEEIQRVVIAYEPVWAIGTGKTASPEQAQEMHQHIRKFIENQYDSEVSDSISILYGGSVNSTNAESLFLQNDVDGALIGSASLNADDFIQIINLSSLKITNTN
jgi:triosephosphate isomerase